MQVRIKKVTTTYYDLEGKERKTEVKYYPQVKHKYIPTWIYVEFPAFGYLSLRSAKEKLLEYIDCKTEEVEYLDL